MNAPVLHQRWLVIALLVFAAVYVGFLYDTHRLPPAARRLRAADIPISVKELKEKYAPEPVEDNGAFLYMEAAQKLQAPDKSICEHLPIAGDLQFSYGHHFTPEEREALGAYINLNRTSLTLIQEAQKKPFVRLPAERYGYTALYFLEETRSLARLVCCAMLEASIAGDVERLEQMVIAGLRLHEILASGGVLIHELVAQAICAMVLETFESSLAYLQPSSGGIHQWQQSLVQERYSGFTATNQALQYETTLNYPMFNFEGHLFEYSEAEALQVIPFKWVFEWTQYHYLPQNAYIKLMTALVEIDEPDLYLFLVKRSNYMGTESYGFRYNMLYLTGAYYPRVYRSTGRIVAQAMAAHAALAALLYQKHQGHFPDTLDDLVPDYVDAVPRDPFTPDSAIRYRIRDDHVVFYSIGPNEQDDGGTQHEDSWLEGGDIIFRLPLVEGKHDES